MQETKHSQFTDNVMFSFKQDWAVFPVQNHKIDFTKLAQFICSNKSIFAKPIYCFYKNNVFSNNLINPKSQTNSSGVSRYPHWYPERKRTKRYFPIFSNQMWTSLMLNMRTILFCCSLHQLTVLSNYQDVPTNLDLVFLTKCIFPKGKGALDEVPEFLQLIGKKVKLFLKLMIRTAWIVSDFVKFASLHAVTRLKS